MKSRALGAVGCRPISRCASTTTSNQNQGARGPKTQTFLDANNPANFAQTGARRVARKPVVYLAPKQKEEILALHDEDPVRWTATVLATRFGAPRENVQMLLRLGQERTRREHFLSSLPKEQKSNIQKLKDQAISAWSELSTERPLSSRRTHASYLRSQSPPRSRAAGSRPTISVDELRSVAFQKDGDNNDQHAAETSIEAETNDVNEEDNVEHSEWEKNLDHLCASAETDTVRRWSFAFIEIGRRKRVRRGVWLREGQSGKLRKADEEERKLFLNQVNMRDTQAFKQEQ